MRQREAPVVVFDTLGVDAAVSTVGAVRLIDPDLQLGAVEADFILHRKLVARFVLGETPVVNEWHQLPGFVLWHHQLFEVSPRALTRLRDVPPQSIVFAPQQSPTGPSEREATPHINIGPAHPGFSPLVPLPELPSDGLDVLVLGSDLAVELLAVPIFEFGEAQVLRVVVSLHMVAQVRELPVSARALRAIINLFRQVVVELMLILAVQVVADFAAKVAVHWMMVLK